MARGRVECTHVRRMCRSGRARLLYMQTGTRNAGQGVEWKGRQVCGRCALGKACGAYSDCASYNCRNSTCLPTVPFVHTPHLLHAYLDSGFYFNSFLCIHGKVSRINTRHISVFNLFLTFNITIAW